MSGTGWGASWGGSWAEAPVAPRYRDASVGGGIEATVEERADGSVIIRSTEALRGYPDRLTDCLLQWAQEAPERTFVARRQPGEADDKAGGRDWQRVSYAQMLQRVQAVAQVLVDLQLSVDRPVAILSDNDIESLTLALAAMWAGVPYVPYVPVSSGYSLISQDYGKLRHILGTVTPGLVFASGPAYAKAIAAVVSADVTVVLTEGLATAAATGLLAGRDVRAFASLLFAQPGLRLAAANAAIGPDTIAKFLFASGSTQAPKGVINTHRMRCANQQMLRQCMGFLAEEPPVLVDWRPWNHTFGGNHNLGGTLYIDEGQPTPKGIAQTLRNLREISPTVYFNVPKGFEEVALAMAADTQLRDSLFKRCKTFMFAGAGLSQPVWDKLDAHGEAATGERVRIITSLGMTETAPACTFAVGTHLRSGWIGLPLPGVEVKLVKDASTGDKAEIRFRGPNVMPGYWRAPEQTAKAFDAEGFYRTGDTARWVDPTEPQLGLIFDGRTAEDFKRSTGSFVSVGPLRAKITVAGDPCVQDAVITGLNREDVGALIFPRPDVCRKLAGLGEDAPLVEVLQHVKVQAFFQALVDKLWREATGSASRVARLHALAEPPALDQGEVTDKGSINQRAVLSQRATLVEALYQGGVADPLSDPAEPLLTPARWSSGTT